ncbi:MAG TPA: DUF624 domain-containing protein [Erysipelothrix sp.]
MNGIMKVTYKIGQVLLDLIKLQLYWLLFTLKGGVILGLFPATTVVLDYSLQYFDKKPFALKYDVLNEKWKAYFKDTNILGYVMLVIVGILYVDLRISQHFIQSVVIHYFLIFILIIAFGTFIYVFPSYIRYEMPTLKHIKQAFLLLITNIFDVIAIALGLWLVTWLIVFIPALSLIAFIPLLSIPIAWFSLISMKKIEAHQAMMSGDSD